MYEKYQTLKKSDLVVFNRRVLASILGISYASTNPILYRLVAKGILIHLKRDCYVLADRSGETRKIANELVKPSYISLWTTLSDAGLTTQVPRVIQSVTSKRSCTIETEGLPAFQYVHLPEKLFFGFAPDAEGIFRAEPEKALLDILYVQSGNIDAGSIPWKRLQRGAVEEYLRAFPRWVIKALISAFPPSS
ncbi:MAG: hypothetical protein AAB853_00450 [Patescibacteria group bacterium]